MTVTARRPNVRGYTALSIAAGGDHGGTVSGEQHGGRRRSRWQRNRGRGSERADERQRHQKNGQDQYEHSTSN